MVEMPRLVKTSIRIASSPAEETDIITYCELV